MPFAGNDNPLAAKGSDCVKWILFAVSYRDSLFLKKKNYRFAPRPKRFSKSAEGPWVSAVLCCTRIGKRECRRREDGGSDGED